MAVLPTESGYFAAVNAAHFEAVDRLSGASLAPSESLALCLAGPEELERWTGALAPDVQRMTRRLWPGALSLLLPLRDFPHSTGTSSSRWVPDGVLKIRCPAHPVTEAVLIGAEFPVLALEIDRPAGTEQTADDFANRESVSIVVSAGPILTTPITKIIVDSSGWRLGASGGLSPDEIRSAAARWVVFVCTGNTCRSPMAATLCQTLLAARLGCGVSELPARGYQISSAGVAASQGDGASPEAIDVVRELGADLSEHRSRLLSMQLVAQADHLIAMTRNHLIAILSRYPVIGGTMRLLCGAEGDLDDPIGGGSEVYAACARSILRHLDRILLEMVG
jgi:protein-tyrosine phosphatase